VGVKNLGPAFVFGFPDPAAKVTVTATAGTTVVSVPEGCVKAGTAYVCTTTASPFNVNTAVTWPFKLRIDKTGTLTGKVSVKSSQPDGSTANDIAKLLVSRPVGAGAGAGAGDGGAGGGRGRVRDQQPSQGSFHRVTPGSTEAARRPSAGPLSRLHGRRASAVRD
jgi:hypothetical protein